jgi:hypothetical protein
MPRQRNNSSPAPDSPRSVPRREELSNLARIVVTLRQDFQDSMVEVNRQLGSMRSGVIRQLVARLDTLESDHTDTMRSDIDILVQRLDELELKIDDLESQRTPELSINAGKISAKTRRKSKKPIKRKHKKSKRKKHRKPNN